MMKLLFGDSRESLFLHNCCRLVVTLSCASNILATFSTHGALLRVIAHNTMILLPFSAKNLY